MAVLAMSRLIGVARQVGLDQCYMLCRDLRALLKLLTHLTQRDLIDFGSQEQQEPGQNGSAPVDVAQLVFLGLDIIIPLVSLELLGFPKLCLLYFQLLAHMMEVGTLHHTALKLCLLYIVLLATLITQSSRVQFVLEMFLLLQHSACRPSA